MYKCTYVCLQATILQLSPKCEQAFSVLGQCTIVCCKRVGARLSFLYCRSTILDLCMEVVHVFLLMDVFQQCRSMSEQRFVVSVTEYTPYTRTHAHTHACTQHTNTHTHTHTHTHTYTHTHTHTAQTALGGSTIYTHHYTMEGYTTCRHSCVQTCFTMMSELTILVKGVLLYRHSTYLQVFFSHCAQLLWSGLFEQVQERFHNQFLCLSNHNKRKQDWSRVI